jgi:hypothetical protein
VPPPLTGMGAAGRSAARLPDIVKEIRNKALAMEVHSIQAKDSELIEVSTEIKKGAERRLGDMMADKPKAQGAREPGTNRGTTRDIEKPASYEDAGIDKNLANRARKEAKKTVEKFEADLKKAISIARRRRRGAQAGGIRVRTETEAVVLMFNSRASEAPPSSRCSVGLSATADPTITTGVRNRPRRPVAAGAAFVAAVGGLLAADIEGDPGTPPLPEFALALHRHGNRVGSGMRSCGNAAVSGLDG